MKIDCQQTYNQVIVEQKRMLFVYGSLAVLDREMAALYNDGHFDGDFPDIQSCMLTLNAAVLEMADAIDAYDQAEDQAA